jgi:hypothetical protein
MCIHFNKYSRAHATQRLYIHTWIYIHICVNTHRHIHLGCTYSKPHYIHTYMYTYMHMQYMYLPLVYTVAAKRLATPHGTLFAAPVCQTVCGLRSHVCSGSSVAWFWCVERDTCKHRHVHIDVDSQAHDLPICVGLYVCMYVCIFEHGNMHIGIYSPTCDLCINVYRYVCMYICICLQLQAYTHQCWIRTGTHVYYEYWVCALSHTHIYCYTIHIHKFAGWERKELICVFRMYIHTYIV